MTTKWILKHKELEKVLAHLFYMEGYITEMKKEIRLLDKTLTEKER